MKLLAELIQIIIVDELLIRVSEHFEAPVNLTWNGQLYF